MDSFHVRMDERRVIKDQDQTSGRIASSDRAAKVNTTADAVVTANSAVFMGTGINNNFSFLQPPPNHLRGLLSAGATGTLESGISGNVHQHQHQHQHHPGAIDPGNTNTNVADLMRRKLMLEWQGHLELLSSPQNQPLIQPTGNIATDLSQHHLSSGQSSQLPGLFTQSMIAKSLPSSSSCEGPPTKKAKRMLERSTSTTDKVTVDALVMPLSRSERKADFPGPPVSGNGRKLAVCMLTSLKKTWERLERLSDAMDDTAADQEAFVKEFFTRALYSRHKLDDLLKEKIQALKAKGTANRESRGKGSPKR